MGKRLYVGNVSYDADEQSLRDVFGDYNVTEVKIVMDKETGRPRGFCFVELDSDKAAAEAVQQLDGVEMMGRRLKINEALERPRGSGGGSRGDRGGESRGRNNGGGRGRRDD